MPGLCTRDLAVIKLAIGTVEGIGLPLPVGCDSNSHHTMWGDKEVKPRGRMLLEFLTLSGMQIANRGSVVSWRVSLEVSLSDHRHIFFGLDESTQLIENGYRNPRATQWDLYLEDLKGRLIGIPSRYESEADVEVVLNRLNSAIVESFEANCPLKQRTSSSKTPWWNSHVESHRRKGYLAGQLRGHHPTALSSQAEQVVERWCLDEGLRVNPEKADLVTFTRKRKLGPLPEITLAGKVIPYKSSSKYLGVTIDSKLNWNEHIVIAPRRPPQPYGRVEEPFGCTWGLRPRILHWMYTAIVRPVITYGAIVWWPGTRTDKARKQLDKVQRLACLGITSAMRTAPSRAIEVLTGLPPLHLVIEHEAMRSAYRLTGLGHWIGEEQTTGHATIWNKATEHCPVLLMLQDSVEPTICPSPKLRIQIPSRDDWDNTNNTICQNGIIWFTDGSKIGDKAGAGVYGKTTRTKLSFALGSYASVFQAEIYAILACGMEILKTAPKRRTIQICTDSQAALMAIESSKVKSRLVLDCKKDSK
ncbi:hypothetical protein NQ318_008359 [Aromia moschata]|uniref:RNase H type-1 domain-containing protein n=1 Tax=Aromia moschata TaxID=1265417 RepID=A0AAV8YI40_9CUCU|nr:hypothetical protein NQ318_008359 [Aromia moschata]